MAFSIVFTNADGLVVNLNDEVNTFTMAGITEDLMPAFDFQEHSSPLIAGSVVAGVRVEPRSFSLPLTIKDVDRPSALARARAIFKILNPSKGDGTLTVSSDGVTRVLTCRYREGFTADGAGDQQFTNWIKAVVVFYAADPYFYAQSSYLLTAQQQFAPHNFFPLFPLQLAQSTLYTLETLQNNGDVPAYPVIVIIGPASSVVITNNTTGKYMQIGAVAAGETITVDARPRTRGVRDQLGTNRFALLTALSSMFPLLEGGNEVKIEISGGAAETEVTLSYTPAYLSV